LEESFYYLLDYLIISEFGKFNPKNSNSKGLRAGVDRLPASDPCLLAAGERRVAGGTK
jgi:hypothetical protein